MHGDCKYARHRPEAEGDDENQREYDAGNSACELEETPDDEPQPWRGRSVLRGEEIQHKGKDRAGQGADIADENGLAEHLEPLLPAPEPFTEIGPYPRAVFQGKNAVEVADEVAEIAEQRAQIHFRADRCDNQRGEEYHRRQSHLQTLACDRLAIGIVEQRKLLVWKDGYGLRHRDHCAQVSNGTSVKQNGCQTEKGRVAWTRPGLSRSIDQDAFFLRNASTNLINSMVPSQSLVVAGLKPFF